MPFNYCEKFGFDQNRIDEYLAILQLTDKDLQTAVEFRDLVIVDHGENIVKQFYAQILKHPDAQAVMALGFDSGQLQQTFLKYLQDLGVGFNSEEYFESRLRIGMAHVWAGVGLGIYQCSYSVLHRLLIEHIPADLDQRGVFIDYLAKITVLDTFLAVEAFHRVKIDSLETMLDREQKNLSSLKHEYQYDSLTKLLSRQSILGILKDRISDTEQVGSLCIIMADIDFFKKINDYYGHLVGDQILCGVAKRLDASTREKDYVGRYGGEEFVFLLHTSELNTATRIAERIREDIDSAPFNIDNHQIHVTISLGLAMVSPQDDARSALEKADKALYQAKNAGRNRVEVDKL